MIDIIILYVRFHIHKCKFSSKKTSFFYFRKEIEHHIDIIRFSIKQNSIKMVKVCKRFNIFFINLY